MRLTAMLLCVLGTGCAGSMSNISDLRDAAPEWYEARKVEFQGKGYPSLGEVPENTTYKSRQSTLFKTGTEREEIRKAFFADPRSEPANLTAAEISAWGRELRERVQANIPPADFLTDREIALMRARFERPRARR